MPRARLNHPAGSAEDFPVTRRHWRAAAGLGWCLLVVLVAFAGDSQVPLLSLVDLGFHELGHLLTYALPWEAVTALMGSVLQVGVPLGLAGYFGWMRHDRVAAAVCLGWAGTSTRDVSVYIADAPYQRLPLIGGEHDWAFKLERNLHWAEPMSDLVWMVGLAMVASAAALCVAEVVTADRLRRPPAPRPTFAGKVHLRD